MPQLQPDKVCVTMKSDYKDLESKKLHRQTLIRAQVSNDFGLETETEAGVGSE